jgi:hypothetical protein
MKYTKGGMRQAVAERLHALREAHEEQAFPPLRAN